MGTSLDALNAASSLTQRRPAASSLPLFELPPPSTFQMTSATMQKFPPLSGINTSHPGPAAVSVGQLLTPPSNSTSEGSGASSGIPTGTTPNQSAVQTLPYTPTFFPSGGNTGTTPNGYHSGFTPNGWQSSTPVFNGRSMFSPFPGPLMRNNTNSPTATEGSALPPPPYDLHNVQSYGAPLTLASPTSQHQLPNPNLQNNTTRPPSQQSPITPQDMVSKPPPNPSLFTSMANHNSHPSGYPYPSHTPVSQSPHPQSLSSARVSPTLHHGGVPPGPPHSHFIRPPPPSYSLPAMPGPIMSNLHSPGAQMAMVGISPAGMLPMTFNSGYAANPQSLYGQQRTNTPQQPPTHDRPFKCDQCPQSFNRNHDLKRHKRIHLAVKPFPCNHCDKSFSRKDALKRHILVKGCGNGGATEGGSREDGIKSDSGSEDVNESPTAAAAA